MPANPFTLLIGEEDRQLLEAVANADQRSKAQVLLRGLHLYAKQLGVDVSKPKKPATKKKQR
jgi:hypothetical protein